MMKIPSLIALGLALCSCATSPVSRLSMYDGRPLPMKFAHDGREYLVDVSLREDVILLSRPAIGTLGRALVRDVTLGLSQPGTAYDPWKAAATAYVGGFGCTVTDVFRLGTIDYWEARYICPEGVDLRSQFTIKR